MIYRIIQKIHGQPVYRRFIKFFRCCITIKEADENELKKVRQWVNTDSKTQPLLNPNVTNLVAKRNNRLAGFIQLVRHPDRNDPYAGYWVFGLIVKFRYRGMGIGEELVKNIIKKSKEDNARELLLLVNENNLGAINLYRKAGFKPKTIPALEKKLEEERIVAGRRGLIMSKDLAS